MKEYLRYIVGVVIAFIVLFILFCLCCWHRGTKMINDPSFWKAKNGPIHSKLYVLLEAAKKGLDTFNITYWISWGTLLGAIRNGDIIPHDDDVDLSFLDDNELKEQLPALKEYFDKEGYLLEEHEPIGYKLYFKDDKTYFLDLFSYGELGTPGKLELLAPAAHSSLRYGGYILETELFPLRTYKINDIEVPGPQRGFQWCERTYSKDFYKVARFTHQHHIDGLINYFSLWLASLSKDIPVSKVDQERALSYK